MWCAVQYTSEFVQSHLLSRRLAYFCCKKLSQICTDSSASLSSPGSQSSAAAAPSVSNECVIRTLSFFYTCTEAAVTHELGNGVIRVVNRCGLRNGIQP